MKRLALALTSLTLAGGLSQAAIFEFDVVLSGATEITPNASLGTGTATITYDSTAHTMQVDVTFSGLTGTTTASHIHAPFTGPPAGVATQTPTFAGFPSGVTSGTYLHTFDMTLASSFNPSYVTANGGTVAGAEAALFTAMQNGQSYLNIHSTAFPSGEINGFLTPVPEPAATWAVSAGLLGVFAIMRHCRSRKSA